MLKPPSPEAIEVIRSCALSPESLTLPKKQLPKELYLEVKRVLAALGAEWNTSSQAFIFGYDYQDRLFACLDGSQSLPERNPTAFFPTPTSLASSLIQRSIGLRALRKGAKVLEPSGGRGVLIDACLALRPDLNFEVCEIDPFHREHLSKKGVTLVGNDFLKLECSERYDAIVMNPPFSFLEDKLAWATHLNKALDLLAPGGALIAILPEAAKWRETKAIGAIRSRAEAMGGLFITNAKDAFKESGTLTGTCTLFIGGVETPETIAAAKKATEDQAALNELAAKTAEIARILPDGDHSVAVAETQEACQKHFILPGARLFSDLFSSWGEWKERKASDSSEIRYILGFRGPYGNSHSGILRPDVVEAIKEGLMLSFSYTWYVELVSFDDGYTRVFVTYNEIIGGRMLALVETRSIAYSAVPSEVPEAVAA